jgi:4-amino-4-deoxy-L-arabinose transferase-like glycosyltransferase
MSLKNAFSILKSGDRMFFALCAASILFLAVAYMSHLTFLEIDPRLDEIRRGLVSLEMMLSGNYLVPTLNGEPYLNKPPLYNWLLVLSYKTFGVNEFALRFPVIVAIFWFGWLIYFFAAKYVSRKTAIIAALFFMTNGRILIYDSLVGLIDILYSSIVYGSFMLVYHYGKKENWYKLFIYSYFLVVVGYLMKGFPSIVYQGFLLLVFFIMENKWKILFHRAHFAGIGVMVLLLGIYYFIYFNRVNLSPSELFTKIITESTVRTFKEDANWFKDFGKHFPTYPLVFGYHYAPWTLLLLLIIRKNWLQTLKANRFIWFNSILFFSCFFIYWLSPYIIARYMFMLLPLCFTVAAYYYMEVSRSGDKIRQIIDYTLMTVILLTGAGCLSLPFLSYTNHLPGVIWKSTFIAIILIGCSYACWKIPPLRLPFIILAFVCSRFGFNWFVVEQRGGYILEQKAHAHKVMEIAGDAPMFIEKSDPRANFGEQVNRDGFTFLFELEKQKILPMADTIKPGVLYITDSFTMAKRPHTLFYRWSSTGQSEHFLVSYP